MARRMEIETAESIHGRITAALTELTGWQNDRPDVADYRVTEALQALCRAQTLLGHLRDDRNPEWDTARAALDKRNAEGMADAVWADLRDCARVADVSPTRDSDTYTEPTEYAFHYASRDVRLSQDESGAVHATITAGPDTGRDWRSTDGAEEAVKAMIRDLYGKPCADGYGTGRDSCPGCDASAEQFEDRYAGRLGTMPVHPLA
ncbi:hypothetical protein ACH4S8_38035 [Streptomyces sp. NPDC021080]|uniref:hypothetical protein n=1 Tax=Streptomyces sp. NPDC021080 TaxID=3365110 RepID=UPI003799797A